MDKLTQLENTMLLRDFNIHKEETTSPDIVIFNDTMESLGLTQHVMQPMNKKTIYQTRSSQNLTQKLKSLDEEKHPIIRPLLNHHRYQHPEQVKHSHKNNQEHFKTITNTPN